MGDRHGARAGDADPTTTRAGLSLADRAPSLWLADGDMTWAGHTGTAAWPYAAALPAPVMDGCARASDMSARGRSGGWLCPTAPVTNVVAAPVAACWLPRAKWCWTW